MDDNMSGTIDRIEFKKACKDFKIGISDNEIV